MSLADAQEALLRVPGVVDCILTIEAEELVAVRLVTTSERDAADVRADAVTALARLGVDIDEEQIQVTPERDTHMTELVVEELEHEVRARLQAWNLQVTDEQTLAEVELRHGQDVALGRATSRGAGQAPELLAQACLDALETLVQGRVSLRLVGFMRTRVGVHDVVNVVLQETEGRNERLLVGAALHREETGRAGAYAVLDAVNRRLGDILASPPRDYEIS